MLALRAGKPVLVEKPAGLTAAQVAAVADVAARAGLLFAEAYMYRCHPQIARLLEILKSGEIGTPRHIRAQFGFNAGFNPASRLYDRALGGGGIMDVGGYPVSLARLVAGAAVGRAFADPVTVKGSGIVGQSGVDEVAYGLLGFAGGFTAEVACAIARTMDNRAVIEGDKGRIELVDPWVPGRNAGPSDATISVTVGGETRVEVLRSPQHLFAFEAELFSRTIAEGATEAPFPALSPADSLGNAVVLDRWRAELGYVNIAEDPKANRALTAMRHLDDIEAWSARAEIEMSPLSGKTPRALRAVLTEWPLVSAPMAETMTGASRAAVQRNLAWMEARGLIREMTGQGRYRMWRATN